MGRIRRSEMCVDIQRLQNDAVKKTKGKINLRGRG